MSEVIIMKLMDMLDDLKADTRQETDEIADEELVISIRARELYQMRQGYMAIIAPLFLTEAQESRISARVWEEAQRIEEEEKKKKEQNKKDEIAKLFEMFRVR